MLQSLNDTVNIIKETPTDILNRRLNIAENSAFANVINVLILETNMTTIERIKSELEALKIDYVLRVKESDYCDSDYHCGKLDGLCNAITIIDSIVNDGE